MPSPNRYGDVFTNPGSTGFPHLTLSGGVTCVRSDQNLAGTLCCFLRGNAVFMGVGQDAHSSVVHTAVFILTACCCGPAHYGTAGKKTSNLVVEAASCLSNERTQRTVGTLSITPGPAEGGARDRH